MYPPKHFVKQRIAPDVSGSVLLGQIETEANKYIDDAEVFIVKLSPARGTQGSGHAIGIHLPVRGVLHIFDSNIGEFNFPNNNADRVAFLNEWWSLFYSGRFASWQLEEVRGGHY